VANQEKRFSENLDRLLTGQQAESHPDRDDEKTLAFARRMAVLRPEPHPEFKSRLKASLLQKLAEKEARKASRPSWLQTLVGRPAYAVALAAFFIAIVFGGLWASGVFNPAQAPFTPSVVQVSADTDKDRYALGEQVTINVSLKNITAETLNFNEWPPILSLMRESDHMAAYTFAAGIQGKSLAPGETGTFMLTWNQRDASGNQAAQGRYFIELEDLYYQGTAVKLTPVEPVEFQII
jgi:hypothetical protein